MLLLRIRTAITTILATLAATMNMTSSSPVRSLVAASFLDASVVAAAGAARSSRFAHGAVSVTTVPIALIAQAVAASATDAASATSGSATFEDEAAVGAADDATSSTNSNGSSPSCSASPMSSSTETVNESCHADEATAAASADDNTMEEEEVDDRNSNGNGRIDDKAVDVDQGTTTLSSTTGGASVHVADSETTYTQDELSHGMDLGERQYLGMATTIMAASMWSKKSARTLLEEARGYLSEERARGRLPNEILDACRNENVNCVAWAMDGQCDKNPQYMKLKCAPICRSCDYASYENRCPMDDGIMEELRRQDAWRAGRNDLNRMFERLTSEPYLSQYNVTILSSPNHDGIDTTTINRYLPLELQEQSPPPWLITMDNVITEKEAKRLIELGYQEGYQRSTGGGSKKVDGTYEDLVSDGRTSSTAWCQTPSKCLDDDTAQAVIGRLSRLTQLPAANSEHLQLLKYEVGEYYRAHHDYIHHHRDRASGARILTMYLYLNDIPDPEGGGGTNFDLLNITVTPELGKAVLWPNVLNDDPNTIDHRTDHQALPILKDGVVKYGVNAWFHMRDFQTPHSRGCV